MSAFVLPATIFDLRNIGAAIGNEAFVLDELFPNLLLDIDRARAKRRRPAETIKNEVKAVEALRTAMSRVSWWNPLPGSRAHGCYRDCSAYK